jgi:raffinose/stachyose/melibiose transport system permease protein
MARSAPRHLRLNSTDITILIGLTGLALVWLIPFVMMLITSVRGQGDLMSNGIYAMPREWRWDNYVKAWETGNFATYFRNSLLLIVMKVPIGLFISALAAYPLAKMRFRGDDAIFVFFLVGLAVPAQVTLEPLVVLMRTLGIGNSLAALIPPYIGFGVSFQILVLRGFFRILPNELLEAARIDGASEFSIFLKIVLPLSLPVLAALFIIDTLGTWNEFLLPLVLVNSKEWMPVPLGLLQFQGEHSSRYTELMAGVTISIVPVLIIFLFLQRYFVSGLTAGAVKG